MLKLVSDTFRKTKIVAEPQRLFSKIGKMHTMSSGNKCYRKKKNIGVNTSVGMVVAVLRRVVTEGPSVKDHRS